MPGCTVACIVRTDRAVPWKQERRTASAVRRNAAIASAGDYPIVAEPLVALFVSIANPLQLFSAASLVTKLRWQRLTVNPNCVMLFTQADQTPSPCVAPSHGRYTMRE